MINTNPSQFDLDVATRTIYGEARSESFDGKRAVAHVIINRRKKKGTSLAKECLRYKQFSCWNYRDPNSDKLIAAQSSDTLMLECNRALLQALWENARGLDITKGSCHYHTISIKPYWTQGKHPIITIENHVFYNNIAF